MMNFEYIIFPSGRPRVYEKEGRTIWDFTETNTKNKIKSMELVKKDGPSKGQIYKEKMGFSKTQKRLMQAHELPVSTVGLTELKAIRKKARKSRAAQIKDKHTTAVAKRKTKK